MTIQCTDRRKSTKSRSIFVAMAMIAASFATAEAQAQSLGGTYTASALVKRLDGSILEAGDYGYFSSPQDASLFSAGFSAGSSASDKDGGTAYVGLSYTGQGLVPASEYITELRANAGVEYRFILSGGSSTAPVPVSMSYKGSASEGASASVSLSGIGANVSHSTAVGVADYFAGIDYFNFVPDQVYRLVLGAQTSYYNFGYLPEGSSISQSAYADPIFTILGDAAGSYRFVGLPDSAIGTAPPPTSPVPEAATWAMMLAGLGIVGAQMRRRQARISYA